MSIDTLVLNDNKLCLSAWLEVLGKCSIGFTSPRDILLRLASEPKFLKTIKFFILDRQCANMFDVVDDDFVGILKRKGASGFFMLSSVLHPCGDQVTGFDYSLGSIPMTKNDIERLLFKTSA